MPKSAQQRFNEYLDECKETTDCLQALDRAAQLRYGDRGNHYAYTSGYFFMQLSDAVNRLPKRQRAEFRDTFRRAAEKLEQEALINTIKDAA